jgi:hypothetical protein
VAIYRLLQKSAFGPEDAKRTGDAYEMALLRLGIEDRNDPFTETVAQTFSRLHKQVALRAAISAVRLRHVPRGRTIRHRRSVEKSSGADGRLNHASQLARIESQCVA